VKALYLMIIIKSLVVYLPTKWGLTYVWNLGSILGIVVMSQVVRGTLLVLYFRTENPFERVQFIMIESRIGWFLRLVHFNGARLLFLAIFIHIFKGLFLKSYRLIGVWIRGLVLFLGFILVGFAGYVLVWAQIRFWASVVITSLLKVIPYIGQIAILWIWGGFIVGSRTLKFFFVVHFLAPYVLLLVIIAHLLQLHNTGSRNRIGIHGVGIVSFFPYFWIKDLMNLLLYLLFLIFLLFNPFLLGDSEMFLEANPIRRPVHIIPEWYFLFAYAILRAIPNKLLGVVALLASIVSLAFFPLSSSFYSIKHSKQNLMVWIFLLIGVVLRWLGQCLVESPFVSLRIIFSFLYFFSIFIICGLNYVNRWIHTPC
jgi:quinol-cytochrome oxidoreductase complex cytochrome b subunit